MAAPNPRLQRTPLRSPLSRKPLGGKRLTSFIIVLMLAGPALAFAGQAAERKWRSVEFHLAENEAAPGLIRAQMSDQDREVFLHARAELDDRDLDRAEAGKGKYGEPLVRVHLTKGGARKIRALCEKHQRSSLAIVINGKVISVPVIFGPLVGDVLEITGHLPEEDVARLIQSLGAR
jgi:preprotein translocase subunit SecD